MNLYLIRHDECLGQTDPDYHSDPDSSLSSLGQQQAQLTAKFLARVNFTQVISSLLVRSLETAQAIAEPQGLPVEVWTDLREGFSRYYRGRALAELQDKFANARFPKEIDEQGWHHGNDVYDDWQPRCERILKKIGVLPTDGHVALVSHGGLGNYFLHSALGLDFKKPHWFELANGSISRLRFVPHPEAERPNWPLYPPVRLEVHSINEAAHLSELA